MWEPPVPIQKNTAHPAGNQAHKSPSDSNVGNWTPKQAKEYALWLEKKAAEMAGEEKNPKKQVSSRKRKTEDEVSAHCDMVAALTNALRFAEIALDQDRLFDDVGFFHSSEIFLEHARNVSAHLKKIKRAREAAEMV